VAEGVNLFVHLLGAFQVRSGDRVLISSAWPRRKAQALVKLLALQPGHSLHRERVLDVLWPDSEPSAAAGQLRQNLHHLRRTLREARIDDALVESKGPILSLAANVEVDLTAWRQRAVAALSAGESADLDEALGCYGGELLPEDLYEEWTLEPRREVHRLRGQLLITVARSLLNGRQTDAAIVRLDELISLDPLNEEAHRMLMRAYALSGTRDRALRQYQTLRETLERDLGVTPSTETEELYQLIADQREPYDGNGGSGAPSSLPTAAESKGSPGMWRRRPLQAAVAVIAAGGIAAAAVLALAANGDDADEPAFSIRTLSTRHQNTATVDELSGDCETNDLLVEGTLSGTVTGDFNGTMRGTYSAKLFAAEECRKTWASSAITYDDGGGNTLEAKSVSLSLNRATGLQEGVASSSQTDTSTVIVAGGTGRFEGVTGTGTCRVLSFIREEQPGSSSAQTTSDCSLQIWQAAEGPSFVLFAVGDSEEMAVIDSSSSAPSTATIAIGYRNNGTKPMSNASITLAALGGTRLRTALLGEQFVASDRPRWRLGDVAPGESGHITVVLQLTSSEESELSLVPTIEAEELVDPARAEPILIRVVR
jgi:DNA-binding SARP family transcriptional activator